MKQLAETLRKHTEKKLFSKPLLFLFGLQDVNIFTYIFMKHRKKILSAKSLEQFILKDHKKKGKRAFIERDTRTIRPCSLRPRTFIPVHYVPVRYILAFLHPRMFYP